MQILPMHVHYSEIGCLYRGHSEVTKRCSLINSYYLGLHKISFHTISLNLCSAYSLLTINLASWDIGNNKTHSSWINRNWIYDSILDNSQTLWEGQKVLLKCSAAWRGPPGEPAPGIIPLQPTLVKDLTTCTIDPGKQIPNCWPLLP